MPCPPLPVRPPAEIGALAGSPGRSTQLRCRLQAGSRRRQALTLTHFQSCLIGSLSQELFPSAVRTVLLGTTEGSSQKMMAGDPALCCLLVCPAVATTTVMSVAQKLGSVWTAKELRFQKRFQKPQEKLKALKEAAGGLLSNHSEELQAAEELLRETETKTQESNGLLLLVKANLREFSMQSLLEVSDNPRFHLSVLNNFITCENASQQPKFGKADSYEKLEKLGEGPYAAVYKGKSE
ncbi:uncharacterized protein LOC130879914 [Chionomys nivalis]|uniref:uncharacterized protein LOC130879914 n=1 Tax=Chionomys nivalis TaxID=269649 RepID=UPI002591393F|nr:uncharacterized protein LOC130879914 [Chionomys nivalis]